ncbi:hypothetical protein PAXINDRAFT_5483 [Paxillus involutus ATCC 200175]|nr:hypothetical protein PAXINDRAFT_5483 [Paxillus involutus ATCC 200175]
MSNPLPSPQSSSNKGKGKALPVSSESGPPALTPAPKIPQIHWEGNPLFSARTTRLIKWCKENESARIRLFSDSTQDVKDAGRKKEVSGVSKKDYFQQLARQIFVNDTNHELKTYSQSHPHLFTSRINRCVQDLRKKYNEVNSKLGQTGAGMSYEDLVADPSKSNIISNPTDDPDDPDGMAIDGDDLNMYEDCPPGDSAINGPPNDEDPTLHKRPKMTMPHNLRSTMFARESDPESAKMQGYHSRSSSCHTPASEESGDSSSNFTGVTSQSQAGNSSHSRKRVRETPADKITNRFADMSDALVKQLQETRLAKLESKRQKREHEKWIREQEAAEADRERELKRTLALERTEQLKLELELERSRDDSLRWGGDVVRWTYE